MDTEIKQKYEDLPLFKLTDDSFFCLDQDKSESKINQLVGKHIIFELWNKEKHTIQVMPGKLLEYKDNKLLIRQYDDGTKETRKLWTDGYGNDLFKDWEEKISIDNIRGIEEYKKYNPKLEFKEEYKNCICEITNKDNITITVLIHSFEGYELEFDFKYQNDDGSISIGTSSYPLCLVKEIRIINN